MNNSFVDFMKAKVESVCILLKVVYGIYVVYLGICFLFFIRLVFLDKTEFNVEYFLQSNGDGMGFISLSGKYTISIRNAIQSFLMDNAKLAYLTSLTFTILGSLIIGYIFGIIVKMFGKISVSGRPYASEMGLLIKHIGIGIILYGFLEKAIAPFIFWVVGMSKGDIFAIDLFSIFVGGVVICVSYFWEYGLELQRESDETL